MAHWLCSARTVQVEGLVSRFDPRFWTVDFPRPMMASVVNIDRMFVSLVPPDYTEADVPLATVREGWVTWTDIVCSGPGSVIAIGDAIVPEHGLRIASGYDDSYNLTPARLLRNALHLGYRGSITHYVGMSHYFRLEEAGGGFYVSAAGGVLNAACLAWHRDLAARAKALGVAAGDARRVRAFRYCRGRRGRGCVR